MMRIYNFIILGVFVATLFSCKKNADPSDEELGYSYYPIKEGEFTVYNVLDTAFEGVGIFNIKKYSIKEEIHEEKRQDGRGGKDNLDLETLRRIARDIVSDRK